MSRMSAYARIPIRGGFVVLHDGRVEAAVVEFELRASLGGWARVVMGGDGWTTQSLRGRRRI